MYIAYQNDRERLCVSHRNSSSDSTQVSLGQLQNEILLYLTAAIGAIEAAAVGTIVQEASADPLQKRVARVGCRVGAPGGSCRRPWGARRAGRVSITPPSCSRLRRCARKIGSLRDPHRPADRHRNTDRGTIGGEKNSFMRATHDSAPIGASLDRRFSRYVPDKLLYGN